MFHDHEFKAIMTETFWILADWQARYIELYQLGHKPKMKLNAAYLNLGLSDAHPLPNHMTLEFNMTPLTRFTIVTQIKKDNLEFFFANYSNIKDAWTVKTKFEIEDVDPVFLVDADSFANAENGAPLVPPIEKK
jgi:hypothetical protein